MPGRVLLAILTMLWLATPAVASAQTVTFTAMNPVEWLNAEREDRAFTEVSYQDCLDDGTIRFNFSVAGAGADLTLQAWVSGSSCSEEERSDGRCVEINGNIPINATTLDVRLRTLLSPVADVMAIDDAAAFCGAISPPGSVIFRLMFVSGSTQQGQEASQTFNYDMEGPPAPTGLSLGIGEERLFPSWEASSAPDLNGYYIYCEPVGAEGCTGTILKPGERPDPSAKCGTSDSAAAESGVADIGLVNGQRYAVGVAAYDTDGNPGPLSTLVCGTPEPVTGYYEAYRAAGGKAGGGFCAFGRRGVGAAGALWTLAFGLLVYRRRVARGRA